MADLKISQLSDGGNSQATDEYVIARSGANYRIDGASIAAAATSVGTLTALTVSGTARFASSAGSTQGVRVYGAAGANQWDIYTNSTNLRISDNTGGGLLVVDTGATIGGNLGIGQTPNAWGSVFKAVQANLAHFAGYKDGSPNVAAVVSANAYYDGTNWVRNEALRAVKYELQTTGDFAHVWYTAVTGAGGGTISTWAQRMALSAVGNVGIGMNPPSDTTLSVAVADSATLQRVANFTNGANADFQVQIKTSETVIGPSTATPLIFANTSGTERARIPAAGGVQVVGAISVGNATPVTSGVGVTFPATQSASTNANTLDDYEEGTWTPTVTASTGTPSYSSQNGVYVKIGQLVYANFQINFTKGTLSGGTCAVGGLPFTANGSGYYPEFAILIDNLATALTNPLAQVNQGNTFADLIENNGSTGAHAGLSPSYLNTSTTMVLRGTAIYRASA